MVIIRVKVKGKDDSVDVESTKRLFYGIDISGPEISEFPLVDACW